MIENAFSLFSPVCIHCTFSYDIIWIYYDFVSFFLFKTLTRDMVIEDVLGKPMKAFDVFVESIKFIVSHMMKYVNDSEKLQTLTIKSEKDIHWLLTVPAIWKDLSKRFMREAAVQVSSFQFYA